KKRGKRPLRGRMLFENGNLRPELVKPTAVVAEREDVYRGEAGGFSYSAVPPEGWGRAARLGLQVLTCDGHGRLEGRGRRELDGLGILEAFRRVSGRRVVGFAGADHLLVILVGEAERALEDVSPVRALTHVVRQSDEERAEVGAPFDPLEVTGE